MGGVDMGGVDMVGMVGSRPEVDLSIIVALNLFQGPFLLLVNGPGGGMDAETSSARRNGEAAVTDQKSTYTAMVCSCESRSLGAP
jgi:hypothetical protein